MAGRNTDNTQTQMGGNVPGPDVMLGLWASWMDRMSASPQASADHGKPWWEMTADNPASSMLSGGVKQLEESLSKDPTLRSIDQMWNANPLREVVPIDWAEIARALHGLAALAQQTRDGQSHRGVQHRIVALSARGVA